VGRPPTSNIVSTVVASSARREGEEGGLSKRACRLQPIRSTKETKPLNQSYWKAPNWGGSKFPLIGTTQPWPHQPPPPHWSPRAVAQGLQPLAQCGPCGSTRGVSTKGQHLGTLIEGTTSNNGPSAFESAMRKRGGPAPHGTRAPPTWFGMQLSPRRIRRPLGHRRTPWHHLQVGQG
jgi:hypothetical protein